LRDGNVTRELEIVEEIASAGKDLGQFTRDLVSYFRHLLVCRVTGSEKLVSMPADERTKLAALAERFTVSELLSLVEKSAAVAPGSRGRFGGRVPLEAFLMSATKLGAETSVNAILEKLVSLEERIRNGASDPLDDELNKDVQHAPTETAAPAPTADTPHAELWDRLVDAVAQESLTVSSFLRYARPGGSQNNTFVVQFTSDQGFYVKNVHDRSARDLIENKILEIFGKKLAFHAQLAPEEERVPAPEAAAHSEQQPPEQLEEAPNSPEDNENITPDAVQDDEKVKMVLELFDGEIVRVEKQPKTR